MTNQNQVEIENRNHGHFTFFIGLWLLGWTVMTGTMLYALLFDNNGRYSFLFSILTVLFIIGYFIWNQFLWNIRGKHVLIFYDDHLAVIKAGTISIFPKSRVDYIDLLKFDSTKSRQKNVIGQTWGIGGETLIGKCRVRNIYLGAGWTLKESSIMAKKLNQILKEKTEPNNT